MPRTFLSSFGLIAVLVSACAQETPGGEIRLTGSIVQYGRTGSGAPLYGALYAPSGAGPFPVLLYAHGSAPGLLSNEAFEAIAAAFAPRGWAVFAPYRRGQGLSSAAGPYVRDEIASARSAGGLGHAQARLARILATDHMNDQSQAFVWLSQQPFANDRRIAVMGNSFGGIIALLSAERLPVCGAIDAAGAAEIWGEAPDVRTLMMKAAGRARAPVLFLQARNDFDLAPSRDLHVAMRRAGRPAEIRLYPRFGHTERAGHAFAYKGVMIWADDVHAFLTRACP